ncbi:MAG: hypothetical protein P4N59_07775 [Negativicutes bacterium]|nr:hypothetical protein [Negativicutes bacterium]
MPKKSSCRFRVETGTTKADHSPQVGLIAIFRAYRGLGLARAVGDYWTGQSDESTSTEPTQTTSSDASDLVEYLLSLQLAGADCIQDLDLMRRDACVEEAFGRKAPGRSRIQRFLRELGRSFIKAPLGRDPWQMVLGKSVKNIRSKCEAENVGRLKHATIDVEIVPEPATTRLTWRSNSPSHGFPNRVVCIWREADLVLSGGMCRHAADLIARLTAALEMIDEFGVSRLLRAGPECCAPAVLSWVQKREFVYKTKPDGRHWKTYKKNIGYILGMPPEEAPLREMAGESRLVWSAEGSLGDGAFAWAKSHKGGDMGMVKEFLFRKRKGNDDYEYARLQTNVEAIDGLLFQRFLKGDFAVACAIHDIERLAQGAFPAVSAGDAGEGRFQSAILAYNIFTALRQLVFSGAERQMSLDRFRQKFICGVGRMSTKGGRWLNLSQDHIESQMHDVWQCFPP